MHAVAEVEYIKIVKYVNAAADLAEAMQADVRKGDKYTTRTITALARFFASAQALTKFLDMIEKDNVKLN